MNTYRKVSRKNTQRYLILELVLGLGVISGLLWAAPSVEEFHAGLPSGQVVTLYADQDFEAEKLSWGFWPSESHTRMELDTQVVQHGKQSLRLTALEDSDRAFALSNQATYEPGILYRISVYVRRDPGVQESSISFVVNFSEGSGKGIKERVYPSALTRERVGDWERWSGLISPSKTALLGMLLLGVEHTTGRVWFDNITIEKLGDAKDLRPDVWTNLTAGVEIGPTPLQKLMKLREGNTPLYQMATRYNHLLWQSGTLERELRELERCLFNANQSLTSTLRSQFDQSEHLLNQTFQAYTAALRANASSTDPDCIAAAGQLESTLQQLATALAQARKSLPVATQQLPAHLGPQSRSLRPLEADGRMNRLLFGVWSPLDFSSQEQERFGFEFHSTAPGEPKEHTPDKIDFSNVTMTCDRLEQSGFSSTFGMLNFGVHERLYAPQWFIEQHRDEPDFYKLGSDGSHGGHTGNLHSLNYFHPAVRNYIHSYLERYAEFCRNEPRILFYEVALEAYSGFANEKGKHLISYGKHMESAFRDHLQGKYHSIAELNKAWGTDYAGFTAIQPPTDPHIQRWEPPTPLTAEFANFAEQSYIDYLKLIYTSLKNRDPDKPIVARHSSLLSGINGARIFETCDVLSFHRGAPEMNLVNLYLNSLNRYAHRSLAYMEDFWGKQEESGRVWDERAQRRGLEKHVIREGFWGRTLQMKWYSYSTGSYLFEYNGNWFNPRTDLTTWRYCMPGLQTAMRRLESVDWMLTHSQIEPFKILVLQPSASMRVNLPANAPLMEMRLLYHLLAPAGLFFELVPEEYVLDGRCSLDDFSAVLLPQAEFLPTKLQSQLLDYTSKGGMLVALGRPGSYDDLARPSKPLQDGLRALTSEEDWAAAEKAWNASPDPDHRPEGSGFVRVCADKGHLIALHGVGALNGEEQRSALVDLLTLQSPRAAWAENSSFEVLLRVTEDGGRYLCILNPNVDHAIEDTIHISAPVKQAVDLWTVEGSAIPIQPNQVGSQFKLRLGPGEATVVYVGDEP